MGTEQAGYTRNYHNTFVDAYIHMHGINKRGPSDVFAMRNVAEKVERGGEARGVGSGATAVVTVIDADKIKGRGR